MIMKKDCIAMILAGGQGSRLGVLTHDIAKPAVTFGGKYKIIDFTLSNCTHSGIDTVGVLTQYQPLELNTYIGNGQPWDLDRSHGGVYVLPPYTSSQKGEWYKGTANAIYQNLEFIEKFNPDTVVILSGDHIYKMNYIDMVNKLIKNNADVAIAVIEVPWEEASRFGVMSVDENDEIAEFMEKPKEPKSNLASMGVYAFKWEKLREYLVSDEQDPNSSNDFGKNVIPAMLANKEKMIVYRYNGYWKDVGTIQSLWEANMDLIQNPPVCDIYDRNWRIFSRNPVQPPHYLGNSARVTNSCITEGCNIYGEVKNSIISAGVEIGANTVVSDSIIMANVKIGSGVTIEKTIIGPETVVGDRAYIGAQEGQGAMTCDICSADICLLGANIKIGEGVVIRRNTMVDKDIVND